MTIDLPRFPRTTTYTWRLVSGSSVNRPAFGGPIQPFDRMGDRWALEVDTGPLGPDAANALRVDLAKGRREVIAARLPTAGIDAGAPGAPKVKGAGQSGSTVEMDGFTPHFVVRKGWPLNITTGGRRFVYLCAAETVADASGELDLPIFPMLRRSPADNDDVEVAEPWIEGIVEAPSFGFGLLPAITPERFTIEEVE